MQIVIEIPHNLYESMIKGYALSDLGNSELYKAVQHGTPLPEHHGRVIEDCFSDGDSNNNWHTVFNDDTGCYENVVLLDDIKSSPTIIPATKEVNDDDDDECIVTDEVVNILCHDCKHHSEDGCYACYYEPATKEDQTERKCESCKYHDGRGGCLDSCALCRYTPKQTATKEGDGK